VIVLKIWHRLFVYFFAFTVMGVLTVPAALGATSTPIVSGTSYTLSALPTSGKVTLFNKLLEWSYPKNNTLVDSNKQTATDQSVYFTAFLPEGGSPDYQKYVLVSNIYQVSTAAGNYLLEPGQLAVSYASTVSPAVAGQLSVWYSPGITTVGSVYKWNGTNNINLGGITDSKKCTVTAPFQFDSSGDGYYAVFLAQQAFTEFDTQTDVSWSYPCVMPLWAKGYVEPLPLGAATGAFGLTANVNRIEFAAMLIKGLQLVLTAQPASDAEQVFADTFGGGSIDFFEAEPEDIDAAYFGAGYSAASGYKVFDSGHMPVQYAETAARNGIIVGYRNAVTGLMEFKPANSLTRQEAAVILARLSNLKLSDNGDQVKTGLEAVFDDAALIAPWAAPSVLAVQKAQLIAGKPTTVPDSTKLMFDPAGNLTRAEAITLSYRLLKKLKKI
jgi:hypothetical protein